MTPKWHFEINWPLEFEKPHPLTKYFLGFVNKITYFLRMNFNHKPRTTKMTSSPCINLQELIICIVPTLNLSCDNNRPVSGSSKAFWLNSTIEDYNYFFLTAFKIFFIKVLPFFLFGFNVVTPQCCSTWIPFDVLTDVLMSYVLKWKWMKKNRATSNSTSQCC